jgi:nitroimidazol reductase NimA-like FMN-containing flavoprotein (pyridoxamine 5'-phosphate oxidase superfamily)
LRRSEKQISDQSEIEAIIRNAIICRLALCDAGRPYIVPMSFGYRDGVLYFHSAPVGRKIDILRNNPLVCFEFDLDTRISKSGNVCNWGVIYRSVIGSGRVFFIEEAAAKCEALALIVEHYGGNGAELPTASVSNTLVFAVRIEEISGKQSLD